MKQGEVIELAAKVVTFPWRIGQAVCIVLLAILVLACFASYPVASTITAIVLFILWWRKL